MAKIYKAYNPLQAETYKYIFYIGILWFVSLFIFVIMDFLKIMQYFGFGYLSFVCLFSGYFGRKIKINLNGLTGEKKALNLVKKLPVNYTIFSNVTLSFEGHSNETDLIVVGTKGVFLIEVKNHLGKISGKENDHKWVQFKETKVGGKYVNYFYNPSKQVKTHVYRLSSILKEDGYPYWIQGIVYFVNPNVELNVSTKQIPVLTLDKSFLSFLEEYEPKRTLTKEEQKLITNSILKQIQLEKNNLRKK